MNIRIKKLYDLFFNGLKVLFFEGWSSFTRKAKDYLHAGSSHSARKNLERWSSYAWPQGGDEWAGCWGGAENQWRATINPRIRNYLPAGHILEIAPGFGRCTQFLLSQCQQLTVVDLTPKCIDYCKKRFADHSHIRYIVNDGTSLKMIDDNSIDFVFSWDSLVHAESEVLRAYLDQLALKLKPGGYGFIHHSNLGSYRRPSSGELTVENPHWRSKSMTAELFRHYCDHAGLVCLSQEIIAWGGTVLNDCFSIFRREPGPSGKTCVVVTNAEFMQEARHARDGGQELVISNHS